MRCLDEKNVPLVAYAWKGMLVSRWSQHRLVLHQFQPLKGTVHAVGVASSEDENCNTTRLRLRARVGRVNYSITCALPLSSRIKAYKPSHQSTEEHIHQPMNGFSSVAALARAIRPVSASSQLA